ncbi:MAG: hypothetical protein HONDAALG_00891 [Gammaproteobacteria bacterium]|nr:hypothetical protein [Gammaproteobacteria bacterium]
MLSAPRRARSRSTSSERSCRCSRALPVSSDALSSRYSSSLPACSSMLSTAPASASRSIRSRSRSRKRRALRCASDDPMRSTLGGSRQCRSCQVVSRTAAQRACRKALSSSSCRRAVNSSASASITGSGKCSTDLKLSGAWKRARGSARRPRARSMSSTSEAPKRLASPARGRRMRSRSVRTPRSCNSARWSRATSSVDSGNRCKAARRASGSRTMMFRPARASHSAPAGVGAMASEAV